MIDVFCSKNVFDMDVDLECVGGKFAGSHIYVWVPRAIFAHIDAEGFMWRDVYELQGDKLVWTITVLDDVLTEAAGNR